MGVHVLTSRGIVPSRGHQHNTQPSLIYFWPGTDLVWQRADRWQWRRGGGEGKLPQEIFTMSGPMHHDPASWFINSFYPVASQPVCTHPWMQIYSIWLGTSRSLGPYLVTWKVFKYVMISSAILHIRPQIHWICLSHENLCTRGAYYEPYSFLLISNKFCNGGTRPRRTIKFLNAPAPPPPTVWPWTSLVGSYA